MADTKSSSPYKDEVKPNIVIRDFMGMYPNRDTHDVEPGQSVHQVNCGVGPQGELRVRLGAKVVKFS